MSDHDDVPSAGATALDVECPACSAPVDARCRDGKFCQARINLAVRMSRERNRKIREKKQ